MRTSTDLDAAVTIIDALIDPDDLSTPEQDYLDVLSDLVEVYEAEAVPIKPVGDAEMLRGKERPPEDRRYNRSVGRRRIVVKHGIGRLRTFRAVAHVNRHARKGTRRGSGPSPGWSTGCGIN